MPPRYDDDADLVRAAQAGDQDAFTTLYRRWFDPCYDVARRIVHDEGRAAEVAQDTFLVAWNQIASLRDPAAFGGWVLRTARNRALNRLERERRSVSTDDTSPVLATLPASADVAGDVARGEQRDLVWAAAAALGERDASVLDLHLRHGLDAAELAEELEVTTNNAYQLLFRMKARLGGAIRAWVVYRDGRPSCAVLHEALVAAGVGSFGPPAVKVIEGHVKTCEVCDRDQAAVLAPEAMFAAVPLFVAGPAVRSIVADGLRAAGVPLGPDAATALPPTGSGDAGGDVGGGDGGTADGGVGDGGVGDGGAGDSAVSDGGAGDGAGNGGSGSPGPEGTGGEAGASTPNAPPPALAPVTAPTPVLSVVREGTGSPDASAPPDRSRRAALVAAAALIVVLLAAGGAVVASRRDGPELASGPGPTTASVGLAPAGSAPDGDPRSGTTASADGAPGSTGGALAPDGTEPGSGTSTSGPGFVVNPAGPTSSVPSPSTTTAPPPSPPPTAPLPPSTPPPTPAPTPAPTTTTTAAPPVIDTFTVVPPSAPGFPCAGQWPTTLTWTTTAAVTVAVEAADMAPVLGLPADGTTVVCRLTPGSPPGGWTLRASGPGGVVTRNA